MEPLDTSKTNFENGFMWYTLLSKASWRNEEVKEGELNGMPSKGV